MIKEHTWSTESYLLIMMMQMKLPMRKWTTRPAKISKISVPASIKSTFVSTPMVLIPNWLIWMRLRMASTLGIHFAGQFQPVRIGQICVGSRDSQDHGIGPGNKFHNHVTNLFFDIHGLISHRNLHAPLSLVQVDRTFVSPGRSTKVRVRTWGE